MKDALYVIEWRHKALPGEWRYWSMRFTERGARRWIEREEAGPRKNMEYRVVRYIREDVGIHD